jgi:hypothetical protein
LAFKRAEEIGASGFRQAFSSCCHKLDHFLALARNDNVFATFRAFDQF